MLIAIDSNGNRVHATSANKSEEYFSPFTKHPVILKQGNIKIHHFALKPGFVDYDSWHHDMSEWHLDIQNMFPPQCQEIVIKHNGEIHRADILKDGVVIEAQNSNITSSDVLKRKVFYNSFGHKLVFLFNFQEKIKGRKMCLTAEYNNGMKEYYLSKRATFEDLDISIFDENFVIFFQLEDGFIQEVKSKNKDSDRFLLFPPIPIDALLDPQGLFKNKVPKIDCPEGTKAKVQNVKGLPKEYYVCDKTNTFGVSLSNCLNCPYFKGSQTTKIKDTLSDVIYCGYNKLDENIIKERVESLIKENVKLDLVNSEIEDCEHGLKIIKIKLKDPKRDINIYSKILLNFENKLVFDFDELEKIRKKAVAAYNKLIKTGVEAKIDITRRVEKIYSHWGHKSSIRILYDWKILVYDSSENISVEVNNIVESLRCNGLIGDCNLYITKDYNFFKSTQAKHAPAYLKYK